YLVFILQYPSEVRCGRIQPSLHVAYHPGGGPPSIWNAGRGADNRQTGTGRRRKISAGGSPQSGRRRRVKSRIPRRVSADGRGALPLTTYVVHWHASALRGSFAPIGRKRKQIDCRRASASAAARSSHLAQDKSQLHRLNRGSNRYATARDVKIN